MSNSDTESESEPQSIGLPPSSLLLLSSSASEGLQGPETISETIEQIQRIKLPDANRIVEDLEIQETISSASNRILSFLDYFQRAPLSTEHSQRHSDFGELVSVSFLTVLFEHRNVFHKIAMQASASEPGSSGAVVCWVDAILSKLGDATVAIASGASLDSITPAFPRSAEIRADEGLRAASQLPSDWYSVAGVIASDQASPAAKRLALRLAFATFVLGPRLCRKNENKTSYEVLGVLDRCVNQTRATGFSASHAGDRLAIQERLSSAMIVSLFATADSQQRKSGNGTHLRPHSLGCLLSLLQTVIHPDDSVASLQLVDPPDELDLPSQLLLRWGDTISWCWEVWDDYRVANAESIVFLTSMWLKSKGCFSSSDADTQADIGDVSTASSIAILRVLHHVVLSLSTSFPLARCPSVSTAVISGACFYAVKSVEYLTSSQGDERWIISGLCRCLLNLFVLLEPKNTDGLVSDHILEALSLIDTKTLHLCLAHIQQDSSVRFNARLHERLVLVRNFVSTAPEHTWDTVKLNLVRSVLNFATIVWFSQTHGCLPKQAVAPLLSAVVEFMLQQGSPSLPSEILGDAILTACSAARNDSSFVDECRESLWKLATTSVSFELGVASSFAHYIVTSDSLCPSLYCAEAWRYLGEVLLLILKHHYIGEQEPLALLISPTICGGMMRLLQADSASCQYMLSTPFALNLFAGLKNVCEGCGSEEYFDFMKERLSEIGPRFLELIRCKSRMAAICPLRAVPMRLMFYRMYGTSHLVFVPDG